MRGSYNVILLQWLLITLEIIVYGQSSVSKLCCLHVLNWVIITMMGPVVRGFQYIWELYHGPDMGPEWKQTLCPHSGPMYVLVAFKRITVSDVAPAPSGLLYMNPCPITIRHPDNSAPGLFGTKVDYSAPGLFGPWTIRPLDYSASGGMEWNKCMKWPNKSKELKKYKKWLTNHTILALNHKTQILAWLEFGLRPNT